MAVDYINIINKKAASGKQKSRLIFSRFLEILLHYKVNK